MWPGLANRTNVLQQGPLPDRSMRNVHGAGPPHRKSVARPTNFLMSSVIASSSSLCHTEPVRVPAGMSQPLVSESDRRPTEAQQPGRAPVAASRLPALRSLRPSESVTGVLGFVRPNRRAVTSTAATGSGGQISGGSAGGETRQSCDSARLHGRRAATRHLLRPPRESAPLNSFVPSRGKFTPSLPQLRASSSLARRTQRDEPRTMRVRRH